MLLGIAVMVVGFLIVWKTDALYEWLGVSDFAERKFGPGGSRFFYKLIGIGVVFVGIFIATNLINSILHGIFSIFTPGLK